MIYIFVGDGLSLFKLNWFQCTTTCISPYSSQTHLLKITLVTLKFVCIFTFYIVAIQALLSSHGFTTHTVKVIQSYGGPGTLVKLYICIYSVVVI